MLGGAPEGATAAAVEIVVAVRLGEGGVERLPDAALVDPRLGLHVAEVDALLGVRDVLVIGAAGLDLRRRDQLEGADALPVVEVLVRADVLRRETHLEIVGNGVPPLRVCFLGFL